ncbi:transporter substrate-binding domain-containing protein [Chromobacterium amazonense]|uniref:substrate-binding periplasmic protein n=1 Tax=Chromobacterium amazonense TaxID=1382803 RepID=UPI00237D9DAE|nr:transporter substrate-binding domain-containing protein [Chromobacterium amazonense]MDE1716404.1 transporter substrate-binding domain-containing protein [Chromobacterium amazonense]
MRLLCVLCALLFCPPSGAVTALGGVAPPYVLPQPPAQDFAIAVLQEASKRLGEPLQISIQPLVRTLTIGSTQARVLIVPPCRTPQREPLLQWVAPLVSEDFLLINRQGSTISQTKLDGLHVGVVRNSVGHELSKRLQGVVIEIADDEINNARKLAAGHIDVWLAAWNSARYAQRQAGLPLPMLQRGQVLLRCTTYLAASRDFPAASLAPWQRALEEIRSDGTMLQLAKRYDIITPTQLPPPALKH